MKGFLALVMALALTVVVSPAVAAEEPLTIVQSTTDKVLERVQADKDALRADSAKMFSLVSELIFPHFDFNIMSQWVLGEHWNSADAAMQASFVEQFRHLLVRTYATALLEFSDQEITYPEAKPTASENTAVVRQQIGQAGGNVIPITYRLHNKTGPWKVFDVSVDGVSLVKTYRASFGSMIRDGGLDGLIASLSQKNQQIAN